MTREEIFERVQAMMVEMFEKRPDEIHLGAHIVNDLDLDSIDAIDMVVKLQEITGQRVGEDALRGIRTISDIIDVVESQLSSVGAPA